ncbi:MAG: PrsW family intramembrane metalloprotease [Candidatus Vogelbacteria bacterium]|nr:PrsW family intramembrane metalloprotease [Candidatus Vogelbacteria bacterium]
MATEILSLGIDGLIYSFLGGLLPAIIWLWFWLKEDRAHPEPRALVAVVFIAGGLAVVPAYWLEKSGLEIMAPLFGHQLGLTVTLWALIEESLKFLAVYIFALRGRWFDEPVDAMVYMITGALGFAAAENSLFLLSTFVTHGQPVIFLLTGNLRFLGATVVHLVASSIVGGFVGLAFYSQRRRRLAYLAGGLLTATLLHALFNYFIITAKSEGVLKIFVLLWATAIFVIFFFERVKAKTKLYVKKKIIF